MSGTRLVAQTATSTSTAIQGRIKLARLMEMSESELGESVAKIEGHTLFKQMRAAGVISCAEFPAARFAARKFAGYGLRLSGSGLPELVDGNCDLVGLLQKVGQEKFEEWFLGEKSCSDEERARGCAISLPDARRLREFANRAFIKGEFEESSAAPEKVFSAVAGIELADGAPVLAFFHREVWKARYRIDDGRLGEFLSALAPAATAKVHNLLKQLEMIEQRKSTLYRLLEEVLRIQAGYLASGEPAERKALTQRVLAATLSVDPSVINRLISNKSVQLPWGIETPLSTFFPSAKDINRERLYELACEHPDWRDEDLRLELERLCGARLSRRSIAQYRKDFHLGGRYRRA